MHDQHVQISDKIAFTAGYFEPIHMVSSKCIIRKENTDGSFI